ncbi:NAD(P)H-hydrate dehydratase [bacterium]|nr:NAD(P)H-hydrate dehydratase [bacterium]
MKLVTSKQMQALDQAAINNMGVPSLDLMENAGRGVAEEVRLSFPHQQNPNISIVVGKGNNGGDGLVAARYLIEWGYNVEIFLLGAPDSLSPDSVENLKKLKDKNPKIHVIDTFDDLKNLDGVLRNSNVVVDAIFGTGLNAEVSGKYFEIIQYINRLHKPVIAVDIPSGLSADNGKPLGVAIKAAKTITFAVAKVGLVNAPGNEYAGELKVIDIGIPNELLEKAKFSYFLNTPEYFKKYFCKREAESHKGTYGHAVIVAGSFTKIGAGFLTSHSALRAGAGLATYILPEHAYTKFDARYPEIMCEPVVDKGKGHFIQESVSQLLSFAKDKNVVAIGPGIGVEKETQKFVLEVISRLSLPMVIDADGINCISGMLDVLRKRMADIVLTPHPGEMSRLTGLETKEIVENKIEISKKFAQVYQVYLVLKGNRTVIATPDGKVYINPTGNPGMATAGMGDALTGVIAGFVAQGIPFLDAILAAVYIHGLAGDMTAEESGDIGLITTDLIKRVPKAIRLIAEIE